jgi:hypothetical protein
LHTNQPISHISAAAAVAAAAAAAAAITFPGSGDKHNTVINVPEFKNVPQRNSKLVIDVKGNPSLANISDHINNVRVFF